MSEKQSGSKKMNKKQIDAFEIYCELREKKISKPFELVAARTGKSVGTIYNWSSKFDWKEQYKEIVEKAVEEALEDIKLGIKKREVEEKQFFLNILPEMETILRGNSDITIGDYISLLKEYKRSLGEATEIIENRHGFSGEGMETFKKYIGAVKELEEKKDEEFMEQLNKSRKQ